MSQIGLALRKPHTLQVTLQAGATPLSATPIACSVLILQNNASNNMRVGDANVSSNRGVLLASGSPGGAADWGPLIFASTDLSGWYAYGTQNDVIDILYLD